MSLLLLGKEIGLGIFNNAQNVNRNTWHWFLLWNGGVLSEIWASLIGLDSLQIWPKVGELLSQ